MLQDYLESIYYTAMHDALKSPLSFLEDFNLKKNWDKKLPINYWKLIYARLLAVTGDVILANDILADIEKQSTTPQTDHFSGLFYLMRYLVESNINGKTKKAEQYLKHAEKYIKYNRSKAQQCELKLCRAQFYPQSGDADSIEEMLHSALLDAIDADKLDLRYDASLTLCRHYAVSNKLDQLIKEIQLLDDLIFEANHPLQYIALQNFHGIVQLMLQDYTQAETYLQKASKIAQKHGFKLILTAVMINLGLAYCKSDQLDKGIGIHQKNYQLIKSSGLTNSDNARTVLYNLGSALGKQGSYQEAIGIYRELMQNAINSKDKLELNKVKVNIAEYLVESGSYTEAENYLDEALEYFDENSQFLYLTIAWRGKSKLYRAQNQWEQATEAMDYADHYSHRYFSENINLQKQSYQKQLDKIKKDYIIVKSKFAEYEIKSHKACGMDLIGEHSSIKQALQIAIMTARHPYTNVLITGESGTGKEVIARIIHNQSKTTKNLVALNASAVSPNLIESELFGHKRGAFTGATDDRKGKFLLADKGTLLLDEISDMPLEMQVKLLRAIETGTIQPVGSDHEYPVSCRIIGTSNSPLKDLIKAGKFRLDLYHRLGKVEIHLLPLRERKSDISLLVDHFVQRYAEEFGVPKPSVTDDFYERLQDYEFPGNVRELMNIIERIFILKPSYTWDDTQLQGILAESTMTQSKNIRPVAQHIKSIEYQMIYDALQQTGWHQKDAAKILNMTESTLCRRIKKLNLKP